MNERRDSLKRVEQEVRMKLAGERDKSLLGDLRAQCLSFQSRLCSTPTRLDSHDDGGNDDPGKQVLSQRHAQVTA